MHLCRAGANWLPAPDVRASSQLIMRFYSPRLRRWTETGVPNQSIAHPRRFFGA